MNPDIDLRLQSVEKALLDVISRAVPDHEQMARDQINLVIGHLREIGAHWKYALRYELGTMDALRALADQLAEHASGAACNALSEACGAVDSVDRDDFDSVQAAQRKLGAALVQVVNGNDATDPMPQSMLDAVLTHYALIAGRERVWHQGSGLDPDLQSLPSRTSLFDDKAP